MIKAIETHYKGYLFRSRLEARWAVFFDELGIKYEYEKEGYTKDGVYYLPDFEVEHHHLLFETDLMGVVKGELYIEVKPSNFKIDKTFLLKILPIFRPLGGDLLLVVGDPLNNESYYFDMYNYCLVLRDDIKYEKLRCRVTSEGEYLVIERPSHENIRKHYVDLRESNFQNAALAARQARFEHGEVPA